jgi:outer membrane protein assembly factor BamA
LGQGWLCVLLAGSFHAVVADEWRLAGNYQQELQYDDNIGLRAEGSSVFGTIMRPSFNAGWNTRRVQLGLRGNGEVRRYNDRLWDCETYSLGANGAIRQPRHSFSLQGGYSLSCAYVQQAADTRLLFPNIQSENYHLSPVWNWQWSPRDTVTFSTSYNQTDFLPTGPTNAPRGTGALQGQKTYSVNLSEAHKIDQRLSINASGFYSRTEFSQAAFPPQSVYGFQLGLQYALSRAWSVTASGGGNWVERDAVSGFPGNVGGAPRFGQLANVSMLYTGKRENGSLTVARVVNPSAIGQLIQITSFTGHYGYQFTRHLSWTTDGSYHQTELAGQGGGPLSSFNTSSISASTGLSWQFARHWRLAGNYRYRWLKFEADETPRSSNAITVDLTYEWDGLRETR